MVPQELEAPRDPAHRERMATVDEVRIPPAGDGFYAAANHRHDDIETHYSSLERPRECPFCFRGYVTITVEEDSIEHNEAVPCKHCEQATEVRMDEKRRE
jgi:hypothetical protein